MRSDLGDARRVVQYTQSKKLVTVCDGWQLRVTICQLAIKHRPPHLYKWLWPYHFRMRNIVTLLSPVYLSCLRVIVTCDEPSPLLTTHDGLGVLDICHVLVGHPIFLLSWRFRLLESVALTQLQRHQGCFPFYQVD